MSRIIINNRSTHDDSTVIAAVAGVIAGGRVSDNGRCYCYVTTFNNGLAISATRTRAGADSFTAFNDGEG